MLSCYLFLNLGDGSVMRLGRGKHGQYVVCKVSATHRVTYDCSSRVNAMTAWHKLKMLEVV